MQTIITNYKNILQTMEEIWKVYPHKTNKVHLLEVSNLGNINLSLGYHFGKDKILYY